MAENTTVSRLMVGNTTEQLATLHGKDKQVVVDTTKHTAVVMDGVTPGGHPLAREEIKIKSGSPSLRINGGEEATLAGDVTIMSTGSAAAKLYDGVIDFDNTEQVQEVSQDMAVGDMVAYDCCDSPDCSIGDSVYINGQFNTKEYITESGEWEAPVMGTYRITLIGGGDASYANNDYSINGGAGCAPIHKFIKLTKGQIVPVIIGAGGIGVVGNTSLEASRGGITKFGDFEAATSIGANYINGSFYLWLNTQGVNAGYAFGGGIGGGTPSPLAADNNSGKNYGAGGGGYSSRDEGKIFVSNGYQGCIIVEFYDASKDKNISIDMASSVTIKELQAQLAALTARVQELENE